VRDIGRGNLTLRARALYDRARRNPSVRAGVIYGAIGGVVLYVQVVLVASVGTAASPGPLRSNQGISGLVGFVALALSIYGLLIYVFAGRLAARQTGTVASGAIAGLVAGVVASVVTAPLTFILASVAPELAAGVDQLATLGGSLSGAALVMASIVGSILSLGLDAGLGVLGGLLGRQAYRRTA
jgi:hypothetical protein